MAFAFLLELIVMVLCFVFKIELGATLVSELTAGIQCQYNSSNSLGVTWDHIQQEVKSQSCEVDSNVFDVMVVFREPVDLSIYRMLYCFVPHRLMITIMLKTFVFEEKSLK